MDTYNVLDALFRTLPKNVPPQMVQSIRERIIRTIPDKLLVSELESFVRAYTVEEKTTLEVSLLTDDNMIHDFTFTPERYSTTVMRLTNQTLIEFTTYHSSDIHQDDTSPYRAELDIINETGRLYYSVEGDRRIVKSLVAYSEKCLMAIRNIKNGVS